MADPVPTQIERVGWTKAEYDAAPEMADRLHRRILELEDENTRLAGLLAQGQPAVRPNGIERRSLDA